MSAPDGSSFTVSDLDDEEDGPDRFANRVREREFTMAVEEAAKRLRAKRREEEFEAAMAGDTSTITPFATHKPSAVRKRERKAPMVEGFIAYEGSLNMFTGAALSMKTLSAITVAAAVASGINSVLGSRVNVHGPVLYVYREGKDGLTARQKAWEAYNQVEMDDSRMTFVHESLDMKNPEDVKRLAVTANLMGAVLIVLDPVAATGGGKEDAEDFGAYRLGIEKLRTATGAAVLVTHNSGLAVEAASRARGHSTLNDAMDSTVSFKRLPKIQGGGVLVTDTKNRDSAALEDLILEFHPCGPVDAHGKTHSGVPDIQAKTTANANKAKALGDEVVGLFLLMDAEAVLSGDASITAQQVAQFYGMNDTKNVSRKLKKYVQAGLIQNVGSTNQARWTRGPQA